MLAPAPDGARTARAARLRCIRLDRGLTQAQLARAVGVTTTAISQYERGHTDPCVTVLIRILATLECAFEDLLEDPAAAPPPRRAGTTRPIRLSV